MTILSPEHFIPDYGPWLTCCGCFERTHEDEAVHFNGEDYCESCWESKVPRLVKDFVWEMADVLPGINWPGALAAKEAA